MNISANVPAVLVSDYRRISHLEGSCRQISSRFLPERDLRVFESGIGRSCCALGGIGVLMHGSALILHSDQHVAIGNIVVVPSVLRELHSSNCSVSASFCGLKLKKGDKSSDQANYDQGEGETGNRKISLRLQGLGVSLSGLKVQEKLPVVLLTALMFGSLSFRYLRRIWNNRGVFSWKETVLAVFWYMVGQLAMYYLALLSIFAQHWRALCRSFQSTKLVLMCF
jgi:hypothetical protein